MSLNTPNCNGTGTGNTGVPKCFFDIKKIVGMIIVDSSKAYASTVTVNDATFLAALQADVLKTGKDKIYPVFRFKALADNSEDVKVQTSGYGEKAIASDGDYDWTFELANGGKYLHTALRSFNSGTYRVFFVDDANQLIGTTNAGGDLIGITTAFIYTQKFKLNDGSNPTMYQVRISLPKPEEINDKGKLQYYIAGFDFETSVLGNIDLMLYATTAPLAKKAYVGIKESCSKINLYPTYDTEIASASAWVTKDASTGAVVTPSAVTADSVNGGWYITYSSAGTYTIQLVDAAALAALSVGGAPDNGYESDIITLVVPT